MKKSLLKKIVSPIWVPSAKKYLQKERNTHFFGLHLNIPVGVFHPALFFSTKTFGQWIMQQDLKDKKIMEIGCGSGAISILAAKQGANVTCCDINPLSVKTTLQNAVKNQVSLTAMISNIFDKVEKDQFDLILNNPPYYPKDPATTEEYAFYAGTNFEYFKKLFHQSKEYLIPNGRLLLVLSDECNTSFINKVAREEGFIHETIYNRSNFVEKTFIIQYTIQG